MKTIDRNKVLELIAECRMNFSDEDSLLELVEHKEISKENIFDAIYQEYKGVSNGFLSELHESITGKRYEVVGNIETLFVCICCGYKTLSEKYDESEGTGYDICSYCNWENDGTVDISKLSGVNKGSISDYHEKIEANKNFFYKEKWLK